MTLNFINKIAIYLIIIFVLASPSFANEYSTRVRAYMVTNNIDLNVLKQKDPPISIIITIGKNGGSCYWNTNVLSVAKPTEGNMPDLATAQSILAAKAVADAAAAEAAIQAAKSNDQKEYENAFFTLVNQLLVAINDPRKTENPAPKLGFDEIGTLIEVLETTDELGSIKISLKLLKIDAALKRYNPLWWDTAITHTIE